MVFVLLAVIAGVVLTVVTTFSMKPVDGRMIIVTFLLLFSMNFYFIILMVPLKSADKKFKNWLEETKNIIDDEESEHVKRYNKLSLKEKITLFKKYAAKEKGVKIVAVVFISCVAVAVIGYVLLLVCLIFPRQLLFNVGWPLTGGGSTLFYIMVLVSQINKKFIRWLEGVKGFGDSEEQALKKKSGNLGDEVETNKINGDESLPQAKNAQQKKSVRTYDYLLRGEQGALKKEFNKAKPRSKRWKYIFTSSLIAILVGLVILILCAVFESMRLVFVGAPILVVGLVVLASFSGFEAIRNEDYIKWLKETKNITSKEKNIY